MENIIDLSLIGILQKRKSKVVIARLDRAIQVDCQVLDTPVKPGYDGGVNMRIGNEFK
jgi:hypothetical protein